MSPIGPFHGGVTTLLNALFTSAAQGRWLTAVQNPVRLDDQSEPQPDLALLRPAPHFYRRRHPVADDVFLVVEVSDTSLEVDVGDKLPAYGRAGIPEVWIVNLKDDTIEVHREPHFTGYGSKVLLQPGDQASPARFPDVTVDVAALLQR